jgi:hypothetical protein
MDQNDHIDPNRQTDYFTEAVSLIFVTIIMVSLFIKILFF